MSSEYDLSMISEYDRRNFLTNPCWKKLVGCNKEQVRKETAALTQVARTPQNNEINVQAGIVEGIERLAVFFRNFERELENPTLSVGEQAEKILREIDGTS